MTTYTVAVISAGLSQPSSTRLLADRLAQATSGEVVRRGDEVNLDTVELRELAHDITNNLLTGFPSPVLDRAIDTVTSADAVIAVTPVFSASYSGLFKSFFDILDTQALVGTPVLMAATGGSARHSLVLDYALRPLFSYLKAAITPTAVFAATADFGSDEAGRSLTDRVNRAARELAAMMVPVTRDRGGAVAARAATSGAGDADDCDPRGVDEFERGPAPARSLGRAAREPDPFDELVPFEQLLARR